jgi:cytochrome P450
MRCEVRLLRFFGDSVLTTEGDEWKRHRRLTSPSFSEVSPHLLLLSARERC